MTEHHSSAATTGLPFQKRVVEWLMTCFSMEVCRDGVERNHRFLEEALELVQSLGCTRSEAHQLVDYVFNRPVGEPFQELGGSLVTLTALANCHDMDMMEAGETELARVWTKIDKIRAKQAAKPKHSPLPEHAPDAAQAAAKPVDWVDLDGTYHSRSSAEQPKDEQTCHDCGAREPCDEDCPNHVELDPVQSCSAGTDVVREALELAEDVLSRAPFSTGFWPNGMHPQTGIDKIRDAIRSLNEPQEVKEALDLAVNIIMAGEPGDSRAVSNEAVALAAVACGDTSEPVMKVIREALALSRPQGNTP